MIPNDRYTKIVLAIIAILLAVTALGPMLRPQPVRAEASYSYLYMEPGVTVLRKPDGMTQVDGKVVVDMRNGDIWGFPTLSGAPYPVDLSENKPPLSKPMYLGTFDFSAIK
jgi:hypothetical protein